jgi:alginate O-acetyltransferase complex protein AlgI
MTNTSLAFFPFLFLALALFHACGSLRGRRLVLTLASAVYLVSFADAPFDLAPLALLLALGFVGVRSSHRGGSSWKMAAWIVGIVGLFLYLRKYDFVAFLPFLDRIYAIVGMSYILFRMLHLVIDVHQGAIEEKISLVDFFLYTCFFPAFLSGPIQRYEDFHRQLEQAGETPLTHEACLAALSRIANGYLKLLIVAEIFHHYQMECYRLFAQTTGFEGALICMVGLFLQLLYWYFNFAGLMDIVIGLGRFFGFELPENFNRPLGAESYLEFWNRWHITLSDWLKFYIFNPTIKALTYRWPEPAKAPYLGVFAYFITFLVMGLWHGSTWGWFIVGVCIGVGVSANKFYQTVLRKRLGKKGYARLRKRWLYRTVCSGMTLCYVALAMAGGWLEPSIGRKLLGIGVASGSAPMSWAWLLGAFLVSGLAVGLGAAVFKAASGGVERLASTPNRTDGPSRLRQVTIGLRLFVILLLLLDAANVPQFVYMNF